MLKQSAKRHLAVFLSYILPPFMSQRIRSHIYKLRDGKTEARVIRKRAITGSNFIGRTQDVHAYVFSVHGFFDLKNIAIAKAICSTGGDIIEVGANIGTETICFSDIVKDQGNVFAFEPYEQNLMWLRKNAESSKHNNIRIFPVAISDESGNVSFVPPPNDVSTGEGFINKIYKNEESSLMVPCYRLDDFYDDFRNVGCIYIDIEGADLLAIRGAKKTIRKFRPFIIIEVDSKLMEKFDLKYQDIFDELDSLDYKIYNISEFGIGDNVIIENFRRNCLCVPKEKIELTHKIQKSIIFSAILPLNLFYFVE